MLKRLEPETYADVVLVKQEHSGSVTHNHNVGSIMERVVQKVQALRVGAAKQIGASSTLALPAVKKNGKPHDPRPPRGG
jgi:hypothetical protein